ncbi:hypothetical protein GGI04_002599 [Coemansia thaxteri]|nr:hypothetical protein GGI04_002599 [Coemansia thaxteri]
MPPPRSRAGPMDIDIDDTSSWLNAPVREQATAAAAAAEKDDDEPSRKRRVLASPAADSVAPPVLANSPFTFSMPAAEPVPTPMLVDDAEAVRLGDSKPISPNAVIRINMRRRRRQQKARRADGKSNDASSAWTTDSDGDSMPQRQQQAPAGGDDARAALSARLHMHRDLPYVISGYVQLGVNVAMVGLVLALVGHVLLTIQRDVNMKVQEHATEILAEIAACSKQYADNRCHPALRVPAMEHACAAWDACMHRDPTTVGRAKVSAETLAEIINGFIEPISLKTMLFFSVVFFGSLFVSNFAFGAYRHSRVERQQQHTSLGADGRYLQPPPPPEPSSRRHHHYHNPGAHDYDYLASPTPRPPRPLSPPSSTLRMPLVARSRSRSRNGEDAAASNIRTTRYHSRRRRPAQAQGAPPTSNVNYRR